MRLHVTSDVHFDRMAESERREFLEWLSEEKAEGLLIAGDIGEAPTTPGFLEELDRELTIPIHFVLGNHDFWHGSFAGVRAAVRDLVARSSRLIWLSESGVVTLGEGAALVGCEGWGDGRHGDYAGSTDWPRDFLHIEDFKTLGREERRDLMEKLADESAATLDANLQDATGRFRHVLVATHVPPFPEVAIDRDLRICSPGKLPFYTCKAVGDVLLRFADAFPETRLTVLCGHTHWKAETTPRPNLRVVARDAGYGTWYTPATWDLDRTEAPRKEKR